MKLFKTLGLVDVPPLDRNLNLITLSLIVFTVLSSIYFYSLLPEKIPVHFDLQGNVNRYGNKSSIFLLSSITAVLGIGLIILSNYPHTFNYHVKITDANREKQYSLAASMMRQLNAFTTFCLVMMDLVICFLAKELFKGSSFITILAFLLMGGIVFIIANYMIKSGKYK